MATEKKKTIVDKAKELLMGDDTPKERKVEQPKSEHPDLVSTRPLSDAERNPSVMPEPDNVEPIPGQELEPEPAQPQPPQFLDELSIEEIGETLGVENITEFASLYEDDPKAWTNKAGEICKIRINHAYNVLTEAQILPKTGAGDNVINNSEAIARLFKEGRHLDRNDFDACIKYEKSARESEQIADNLIAALPKLDKFLLDFMNLQNARFWIKHYSDKASHEHIEFVRTTVLEPLFKWHKNLTPIIKDYEGGDVRK